MRTREPMCHRLTTIAALACVGVLVVVSAGCRTSSTGQPGRTAPIGGSVIVGDVSWRVLYVRRTPAIDRQFTGSERARGFYVIAEMEAERQSQAGNIDWKPLSLVDAQGRDFPATRVAQEAVDDAGLKPLTAPRIAPGTTVSGWVAFDVAPDARQLRLQVSDVAAADYAFIKLP